MTSTIVQNVIDLMNEAERLKQQRADLVVLLQTRNDELFAVEKVNADLVAALEAMMRQHGGLGCSAAYKQAEVTLAKVKP